MILGGSRLLDALGDEAERLPAGMLAQLREGRGGEFRGILQRAGSRFGTFSVLLRPFVGKGVLLTAFQEGIPLQVRAVPLCSADGRRAVGCVREFGFTRGSQLVEDRLEETADPLRMLSAIGERERLEIVLDCSVTAGGALRLSSRETRLRVGRLRIRLPRLIAVMISVEDGWDVRHARRTIAMEARHPLFGVVMEYRGWYARAEHPSS